MDFQIKEESNSNLICTDIEDFDEADDFDEDGDDENDNESQDQEAVFKETVPNKNYVWRYFRKLEDSEACECVICNASVGNIVSNLARHLAGAHNISRDLEAEKDAAGRGRPSRSFIWKYCTRENPKQALCHLCNKLLFFGSGNTSNIAKHLRRKHSDVLDAKEMGPLASEIDETTTSTTEFRSHNRERKGASYVWNYCMRVSKDTIRCKVCNKNMSFHGTANVITHLARRHNIVGNSQQASKEDQELPIIPLEECELSTVSEQRGRSSSNACNVWRYCKRLSKTEVRCGFCKKNLSFQGTSNLQRHLHRMHGIVPVSRHQTLESSATKAEDTSLRDDDFIWEHISVIDDGKAKCRMCEAEVLVHNMPRHLTQVHSIAQKRKASCNDYDYNDDISEQGDNDKQLYENDWGKTQDNVYIPELTAEDLKKDLSLYDNMIEVVAEAKENSSNGDEDTIDPNSMSFPTNPLSPPSSTDDHKPFNTSNDKCRKFMISKRMEKLNEERTRMETEYFREKAGFYRMQQYLAALQAKKVKLELERLTQQNVVNGDAMAGATTYTVTENINS